MNHARVLPLALCVAALTQAGNAYWQVLHPFNPGAQESVVVNVAGRHNRANATNAVEAFGGSLYYCVYSDGSSHPSKVYRYNAETGVNTLILRSASNAFLALGAMRGHLYISHTDGRLFRTTGGDAEFLTRYPFTAQNHVTAMAEFNTAMYFGTSRGEVYRSTNGLTFQQVTAMSGPIQDLIVWKGALYGCDSSAGGGTSILFRSTNGTSWQVVGAFNIDRFHAFAGGTNNLYVCSTINPAEPSLGIRQTTNGTYWGPVFGDLSQGDAVQGRAVWFAGDRKAYFPSIRDGVSRLFPAWGDEVAAPITMARPYGSLAVVDGKMFAVGSQDANTFVGLLGGYVVAPTPAPTPPPTPQPTVLPTPQPTVDPTPPPTDLPDTDGDGKPDVCEHAVPGPPASRETNIFLPDSDGDGLLDGEEDPGDCDVMITSPLVMTNPRNRDTDGNGLMDGIEFLLLQTDPLDPDDPPDPTDTSRDGLPDYYVIELGQDPNDPDWDGDGFTNGYELLMGSDPLDPDAIPTVGDVDGNGITNNIDAVRLFNFVLGTIPQLARLDRADIRVDAQINNVDAVVLFNWILGTVPFIPVY